MRFFNTAGPIRREEHYHVPPLDRLDADEVRLLIRQRKYFALHAPRQTGKTSALLELRDELNAAGEVRCVYVNVEVGQTAREDVAAGIRAILKTLPSGARNGLDDEWLAATWPGILERAGPHDALRETLSRWAESNPTPVVLLIDEIDALVGDTLLAVLRQLRAGYPERPRRFPQSVVLCGVRDVRDYRIRSVPRTRSSREAVRSTCAPRRCGWGTSCGPMSSRCWRSTPRTPAKRSRRRRELRSGT